MSDQKRNEEEEKGFVVKDKRFSAKKEAEQGPPPKEEARAGQQQETQADQPPLPEITFTSLLLSLSTSALIHLGEIQDPAGQESAKNLPLAKQTIDLITMLKDKTKGNLSSDEEKFMDNVLYDLKLRYVKAVP